MAKIRRNVTINGHSHSIRANSEQEYAEKVLALYGKQDNTPTSAPLFRDYAEKWYTCHQASLEQATRVSYRSQLDRYLLPAFGDTPLNKITAMDIQTMFNGIDRTTETKKKIKVVFSQILKYAEYEGYISKNPLSSPIIKISGKKSSETEPYSQEEMSFLFKNIGRISKEYDRSYLALQLTHPLRLEEALGLRWRDIDLQKNILRIRWAVTHPTRNAPELKDLKTESSKRDLALLPEIVKYLTPGKPDDFVVGGEKPFTCQQVKKMCERIARETGFTDRFQQKITPRRFRTTVLTDILYKTQNVKLVQAAAGHTTANMTLNRYAKNRSSMEECAAAISDLYG